MSAIKDVAERFFVACEDGKGWDVCKEFCHPDATFSAQAPALAEITTVEGYTDWMKGLYTFLTGARYDLKSFGVDEERGNVTALPCSTERTPAKAGPCLPPARAPRANTATACRLRTAASVT